MKTNRRRLTTVGMFLISLGLMGTANAFGDSIPIGTIMAFGGDTSNPEVRLQLFKQGWLPCDGSAVSTVDFVELYSVIGSAFGGNQVELRLPDFRGRFLRGVDQGAGRDPDAGSRPAPVEGGNMGDKVGSVQHDEFKSHAHPYDKLTERGNIASGSYWKFGTVETGAVGGKETRPKNSYVNWIIKAKDLH
ncbi:MAG: tail fiber protein [Thermoanaerobaculia bacterium]|nr:tail fiber protein [Thermoanaerobaculia bacterium]